MTSIADWIEQGECKRCEALEAEVERLRTERDNAIRHGVAEIARLKAALREIADMGTAEGWAEDMRDVARAALEGG